MLSNFFWTKYSIFFELKQKSNTFLSGSHSQTN